MAAQTCQLALLCLCVLSSIKYNFSGTPETSLGTCASQISSSDGLALFVIPKASEGRGPEAPSWFPVLCEAVSC